MDTRKDSEVVEAVLRSPKQQTNPAFFDGETPVDLTGRKTTLDSPQELTRLLEQWSKGDKLALPRLTPLIYAELRKIARYHMSKEAPSHTLQATALLNEAYLRLMDISRPSWNDRKHFFAVASKIMREILVDHARKKRSIKRGGEVIHVSQDEAVSRAESETPLIDVLTIDEALEQLSKIDTRKAQIVELWYFGGLTIEEIASLLDVGKSTVARDLDFSKVFLARAIVGEQ